MRVPTILVIVLLLAGCTARPGVPDDAVTDVADANDGVTLSAWVEHEGDEVLLHAVLENQGDDMVQHRIECGAPWNWTLAGPDGSVDAGVRDPCGEVFLDYLAPGKFLEFRHTWDRQDHNGTITPAPAGTYTWSLQVELLSPRNEVLHTEVTFDLAAAPSDAQAAQDGNETA